ncbi:SHOCT domain-containing protein [Robinsoniella peoriensis]|uniref:SHOCT domain-containing protein n=1 Tax=Robinsoniella peoriensis TaxID=180332 RepID=UPI003635FBE9
MKVTKLTAEQMEVAPKKHQYTEEEMQREYDFIRAGQMTKTLLDKGMITTEEYDIIMTKNRQVFSPVLSDLYPR